MLFMLCTSGDTDFGSRYDDSSDVAVETFREKVDPQQSNRGRGYNWLGGLITSISRHKKERGVCTVLQASAVEQLLLLIDERDGCIIYCIDGTRSEVGSAVTVLQMWHGVVWYDMPARGTASTSEKRGRDKDLRKVPTNATDVACMMLETVNV